MQLCSEGKDEQCSPLLNKHRYKMHLPQSHTALEVLRGCAGDSIHVPVPAGCLVFPAHLKMRWVLVLVSFSFVSNRYFVGRIMRQNAIITRTLPSKAPMSVVSKGAEINHSGDSFGEQHLLYCV